MSTLSGSLMRTSHIGLKERLFWGLSLVAVLILVLVMSVTWWIDPALAYQLRQEGAFFQDLTVVVLLLASGVAVFFIRARKPGLVYLVIPFLGILFAAEELSWIGRIIEPPVINRVRIDALHDFVEVAHNWLRVPAWPTSVIVFGVVLIVCGMLVLARRAAGLFGKHKPLAVAFASVVFIVAGQAVDIIDDKTHFQKYFFEELPENLGALILLIAAASIAYHCRHPSLPPETAS